MRNVKIITDSCADIDGKLLEKYDIDYARMSTMLDGVEDYAYLTWSYDDAHRLYENIRAGKRVTTAQVSVQEFISVFEKYLKLGFDIVYIACSSKQSGSVNTGNVCAQQLLENYPEAKIYCIDSLNASLGEGMLAIEAAKLAKQGKNADEIRDFVISVRKNIRQYVTVHTLEYLRRSGRVSGASAFFGNLINIKPILISDVNGVQTPIKKVRGRGASLDELVEKLKSTVKNPEEQTAYIAHSDCSEEEVDIVVNKIKSEIKFKDVYVGMIGPIIGASIGPDAIGVWGFGDTVTYKAEE